MFNVIFTVRLTDNCAGVRSNMEMWIRKLECDGDVEKQHIFKKKFISCLRQSVIAEATDKANEQHYEVPTEFFQTVLIFLASYYLYIPYIICNLLYVVHILMYSHP